MQELENKQIKEGMGGIFPSKEADINGRKNSAVARRKFMGGNAICGIGLLIGRAHKSL